VHRPDGWNDEVVLRLYRKLPELRRQLNADVLAAFAGDPAAHSIEEIVFSYPAIEAITTYRLAHVLFEERVPMLPRIWSEYAHSRTGIDINAGARIGQSFFIDHGTGVVVGETAVIGNNVKLYQGVTLGALSTRRPPREGEEAKRHPTIEDDVTIYSGATILGGSTVVGRGSVIGGNVWLIKSVPPGSENLRPRAGDARQAGRLRLPIARRVTTLPLVPEHPPLATRLWFAFVCFPRALRRRVRGPRVCRAHSRARASGAEAGAPREAARPRAGAAALVAASTRRPAGGFRAAGHRDVPDAEVSAAPRGARGYRRSQPFVADRWASGQSASKTAALPLGS
jgi:serine O-acetyltransferase